MRTRILLLLLLAAVAVLPVALRPRAGPAGAPRAGGDVLVLISPHPQAVRDEFTRAFQDYYRAQTGRAVALDWRSVGGTSEIVRYLDAQYANAFRQHWENDLGQPWSGAVERGFADARNDGAPGGDDPAQAARRAFLASNVTIGLDVFFGGGSLDFAQQTAKGQLVPSGVEQRHPEWFTPEIFPLTYAGEPLRDPLGRWQGAALSGFGLIFNRDGLRAGGFPGDPTAWSDLADPRFAGAVALADPTQSGSAAKSFEMLIQQQMQERVRALGPSPAPTAQAAAVAAGWAAGLRLAQLAAANSAYFTDAAGKPALDVASGDCVIGMAIDYYGLTEEETLALRNPNDPARAGRFGFVMPRGGSSLSADPIALLRGAPHADVARAFIDFVLSPAGQKLWGFRASAPGGPVAQALRRAPIRRDLYAAAWRPYLSDPESRPYEETGDFVYQPAWTGPIFSEMRFVLKAAFIDPHAELADAWAAIRGARAAGHADAAQAALNKLQDLSVIDYAAVFGPVKTTLAAGSTATFALETELNAHFRQQYAEAKALAEGAR